MEGAERLHTGAIAEVPLVSQLAVRASFRLAFSSSASLIFSSTPKWFNSPFLKGLRRSRKIVLATLGYTHDPRAESPLWGVAPAALAIAHGFWTGI